jgi:hypothetical protein
MLSFEPVALAKAVVLSATVICFVVALGLQVSTSLDLRRYAPVSSLKSNMDQYIIHRYAFEARVPRALRLKYLLSLILASLSFGGMFLLALIQTNAQMAMVFGLVCLVSVTVSASSWKRYLRISE